MDHLNAVTRDILRSPDARKLQELWRAEVSGGQNDLAPSLYGKLRFAFSVEHADRPLVLEQDARSSRVGKNREIGSLARDWVKIGCGRRAALAIAGGIMKLGDLIKTDALIVAGIDAFFGIPTLRRFRRGFRIPARVVSNFSNGSFQTDLMHFRQSIPAPTSISVA
jgi:hypothetical protein